MINHEFDCSCGKKHIASIENIAIGKNALDKLPGIMETQKLKDGSILSKSDKVFIVADVNTWELAGKRVESMVVQAGYNVEKYSFPHKSMHSNDKYD